MTSALIVVDVQNDFCEGGSLAVAGGTDVARRIGELLAAHAAVAAARGGGLVALADGRPRWDLVVATRDHHVDPGSHFSATPDFVDSWPPHCVVGTSGVEFSPALDPRPFDAVFDKGEYTAAYSGFEGLSDGVGLGTWLHDHGVDRVDVCGIATDYCVRATSLDAAGSGFTTTVLAGLTAGVTPDTTSHALTEMSASGVFVDDTRY